MVANTTPYGGNGDAAFSDVTTKRFTGQYHEKDLPGGEGLSYYNARWYDATLPAGGKAAANPTYVAASGARLTKSFS